MRVTVIAAALCFLAQLGLAQISSNGAALFIDCASEDPRLKLGQGVTRTKGKQHGTVLEFTTALQYAEVNFSHALQGANAVSIGGWFFTRRVGEQYLLFRGVPEIGPQGERFFRPKQEWINFVLGTDQHGFLLGTINGNGNMPFPHVTVSEVQFDAWSQLVLVKSSSGVQKFFHNGVLVHSDSNATSRGQPAPLVDAGEGEPVRLAVAQGGLIGEAWVFPRELSEEEIARDYQVKRPRYTPTHTVAPVRLREMNMHNKADLWKRPLTPENWVEERNRIARGIVQVIGTNYEPNVPLDPQVLGAVDCGSYIRKKVSLQVQEGDRMPAYLLIPKNLKERAPAVICFYGTSAGAGKETTVGLSGLRPGSPPQANYSFAVDMAEAGFIALAPDYLRDGERVLPGARPYDTTGFYARHPDWSIHGKDAWDTSKAIDYLQSLGCVDPEKIGMTGHSYGGHSTIFSAALDPRIKVAVANGPVSDFLHHGTHWGVPKGAGNSQSLPAMRPYVLDHTLPAPVTFYEFTSMIAPRPLLVGQAVGERRPMEEENYAAVRQVYSMLGADEKVRYLWYSGDHDYPQEMRRAAVEWFRKWFAAN